MIKIPLTQGQFAVIDAEDALLVSAHKWHADRQPTGFYACASIRLSKKYGDNKTIRMHRLIMNAKEGQIIDHIDGNTLNNCKRNLRFANTSQNGANAERRKRNKSGYKGVSKHAHSKKWQAFIKTTYLGTFETAEEAAKAYNIAALEHFGEFAKLNQILEK